MLQSEIVHHVNEAALMLSEGATEALEVDEMAKELLFELGVHCSAHMHSPHDVVKMPWWSSWCAHNVHLIMERGGVRYPQDAPT